MHLAFVALATAAWLATTSLVGPTRLLEGLGALSLGLIAVAAALDHRALVALLRPSRRALGLGVAAGLAMAAATLAGYPIARTVAPAITPAVARLYALFGEAFTHPIAPALITLVISAEEVVFRGVAIDALTRATTLGAHPARLAVAAALPYALAQLAFGGPLLALTALGCGVVWGWLRVQTRSLVTPLIAHVLWDAAILGALPLES